MWRLREFETPSLRLFSLSLSPLPLPVSVCPLLFSFFPPFFFFSNIRVIFVRSFFLLSIEMVDTRTRVPCKCAECFTGTLINNASSTKIVVLERRGIKWFKVSKQRLNEGSVIYPPSRKETSIINLKLKKMTAASEIGVIPPRLNCGQLRIAYSLKKKKKKKKTISRVYYADWYMLNEAHKFPNNFVRSFSFLHTVENSVYTHSWKYSCRRIAALLRVTSVTRNAF